MRTVYWFCFFFTFFFFKRRVCTCQVRLWISHWPWKSGIKMWWGRKGYCSKQQWQDRCSGQICNDENHTWQQRFPGWFQDLVKMKPVQNDLLPMVCLLCTHKHPQKWSANASNMDSNCKTNLSSAHFVTFSSFAFNNNDTKICTTLYSHPSGPATWQYISTC